MAPSIEGICHVPLTRGYMALLSAADAERVLAFRWRVHINQNGRIYAVRSIREGRYNRPVYLHRFILDAAPGETIDHRNGNGLDDRRENLRRATKQQNAANVSGYSHNTSGFRGVSFHKQRGKWRASIKVNQRFISLGLYASVEDANRAYEAAAREYFGEFVPQGGQ